MDAIPAEILLEILQHVSEKDLRSCVQHLIHPYKRLGPLEYLPHTHEFPMEPSPDLEGSENNPDTWWTKDYAQQKALEDFGAFAKVLELALPRMHNLREISANSNGDDFEHLGENRIIGFCAIDDEHRVAEHFLVVLKGFMTAALHAGIRLHILSMYSIWRGVLTDGSEALWKRQMFRNLTSLSVSFRTNATEGDYSAMREDVNEGRIFESLSSAPRLRLLSLRLEWIPFQNVGAMLDSPALSLRKVFGENFVWKHLETFLFNGIPINEEELTHFLGRHATTLKTLGLLSPSTLRDLERRSRLYQRTS
ncbi:hypothetical protein RUND412_011005 [Rhizina undulata]